MTRVMVVDDSALARQRAREPLEDAGFEVVEAEDGARALAELDRVAPDALVLNVEMPAKGGVQVMETLREQEAGLPVVVSTARDDEATARRLLEAGAHDFLPKDPLFEVHVANAVRLGVQLAQTEPPSIEEADPIQALVLDDSPLIRRFVRSVLAEGQMPVEVAEAEDVREAHRVLEDGRPDVLLVDHELPGTSGAAFLEELQDRDLHVPAMGLSGTREPELARRFVDAGAYGMWIKEHEAPLRLRTSVEHLARWNRARTSPAP